jgi:hypothetical protein
VPPGQYGPPQYQPPAPPQYQPPAPPPGQYGPPPQYQPPAPPPGQYGPPPQYSPPPAGGPVPPAPLQFPGPPGPFPGAPAAKKAARRRSILSLVAIAALLLGLYGVNSYLKRNDIGKAAVGDCVSYTSGNSDPYKLADCSNADATYVVLKIAKGGEQCKTVAGAERSKSIDSGEVCLGLKGVDPNTAINVAKLGDCIAVVGNDASRVACNSPKATHKVVKVLNNVSKVSVGKQPCDDVPNATASYGWAWQTTIGGSTISAPVYDVVLCLADV